MKVKPQFVASGVGANWLPAARALAMAALLALAATASEQTNGTWTGADGATWDTSAVNWSGFTFYQIRLARHGQGLLSRVTFLRSIAKRRKLGGSASSLTQISNTEGL